LWKLLTKISRTDRKEFMGSVKKPTREHRHEFLEIIYETCKYKGTHGTYLRNLAPQTDNNLWKYVRKLREEDKNLWEVFTKPTLEDRQVLKILTKRMRPDRQELAENTYETYATRQTRTY
jgi:hypothetical protein